MSGESKTILSLAEMIEWIDDELKDIALLRDQDGDAYFDRKTAILKQIKVVLTDHKGAQLDISYAHGYSAGWNEALREDNLGEPPARAMNNRFDSAMLLDEIAAAEVVLRETE